jgi:hypothetical protein
MRHFMHHTGHSRHQGNSLHEILDSTNQVDSARTGNALPAFTSAEMIGYCQNLRTRRVLKLTRVTWGCIVLPIGPGHNLARPCMSVKTERRYRLYPVLMTLVP